MIGTMHGGSPPGHDPVSGAILAALERAGGFGAGRAELESAADASAATVRRRLSELAEAGLIVRDGVGRAVRYRLAGAKGAAPSVAPGGSQAGFPAPQQPEPPAAPPAPPGTPAPLAAVVPPPADPPADPASELPGTPAQPVPPAAPAPPPRGKAIVLPPLSSVPMSGGPDAGAWWRRLQPPSWLRPMWLDRFRTSSSGPGRVSPGAILVAAAGSTVVIGLANALLMWAFMYSGIGVAVTIGLFLIAGGATALMRRGKVFRWVATYMQTLLIISIAVGWWSGRYMARAHASLYVGDGAPVFWPAVVSGAIVFLALFLFSALGLWFAMSPQESQDRQVLAVAASVVVLGAVASWGLVYWQHGHVSREQHKTWVYSPTEQAQQMIVFEYYQGASSSAYSSIEQQYNKIVCPEARETVATAFAPLFELSANQALEIEDGDTAPETIDGDRAMVTMRVIVIEDIQWDNGPHEIYHRGVWKFHFRAAGEGWCMDRIDTPPGYPPGVGAEPAPDTPAPSKDTPEPSYTLPGEGETPTLPGEDD